MTKQLKCNKRAVYGNCYNNLQKTAINRPRLLEVLITEGNEHIN